MSAKEMSMDRKIINQIKALGIDMIQESGSGHPGIVLGAATTLYTVYAKCLNFKKDDPYGLIEIVLLCHLDTAQPYYMLLCIWRE